jgi:hypothetical protein
VANIVKRMYFFSGGSCFEYDPRPGIDRVVKGPTPIATRFKGFKGAFAAGIDAAVNWGDGFIYFFKNEEYWKYDALADRADTPEPRKIADGWPTFPALFASGIDAAFNSGAGKAYFFKGNSFLRYNIDKDRVDDPDPGTSPYPRAIADPHGWRGLTSAFKSGIDAAVFGGNGKIYFFKGPEYARLTFATRAVDIVDPPYPLTIHPIWNGLPSTVDAGVEWIQAGSAILDVTLNDTCQHVLGPGILDAALGRAFQVRASFSSTGHPSVCGSAEYRQFVRGSFVINGERKERLMPNPAGGPDIALLPRPAPGAPDDNFREDGLREDGLMGGSFFYGYRNAPPNPKDKYEQPDQRSGCRYQAIDSPIISAKIGDSVSLDLEFRGVIIDVSADNEVVLEKTWPVNCSRLL